MVIIITGATHTGKTILAQKMLEKYKYPYLSIDHMKMGLIRSGKINLTPYDDEKLTAYLWPIICEIIKTAIENKQNLIVEGCYVPFDWMSFFDADFLKQIRFVCLAMSEVYIEKHFDDIKKYSNIIENRLFDELNIDIIKKDNKAFIDGYNKNKENIILINDNYDDVINALI